MAGFGSAHNLLLWHKVLRPLSFQEFAAHHSVNHGIKEYVNKENPEIHSNTVESYFLVFKRGVKGVYQHCKKDNLHRYLAEYDFRYFYRAKNEYTDKQRIDVALLGVVGKRLTYQRFCEV